jgi:hypothetical protein
MSDIHLELFNQFIIRRSNLQNLRAKGIQNYEIYESEFQFKEVGVAPNILPIELTIQTEND